MLYSDYLPELSRHHKSYGGPANPDLGAEDVSWEDLIGMDLPSFQPAFLVLCRVLLNVIHECLKLRLEQRPAGEPSLLSIKQASGAGALTPPRLRTITNMNLDIFISSIMSPISYFVLCS